MLDLEQHAQAKHQTALGIVESDKTTDISSWCEPADELGLLLFTLYSVGPV